MSQISPLTREDIGEVADLLVRVFQHRKGPATAAMRTYLASLFLDMPGKAEDIHSLVHRGKDGSINGFIGVLTQTMRFHDRTLRAAMCNSFAVDPAVGDPMAAPLLLRTFLKGPQDLSISDRANDTSLQMWRSLRGQTLPYYSLDWLEVLQPAGHLLARAARRKKAFGLLSPLARGLDRMLEKRSKRQAVSGTSRKSPVIAADADEAALLSVIPQLVAQAALHPVWSEAQLRTILRDAEHKAENGEAVRQVVRTPDGKLLGAYLYHVRAGDVAKVIHVLPMPGEADTVLDCLAANAAARGGVAISGRAQPGLIEPLMDRKAVFSSPQRCLVHTRDAEIEAAMRRGDAVLTGLVGEYWTRLNEDGLH